jgi:hypothetical protein
MQRRFLQQLKVRCIARAALVVAGAAWFACVAPLAAQEPPAGRRGPDRDDPNRRPWLEVHFAELDADSDRILTWVEVDAEVSKTFAGYTGGMTDRIRIASLAGPPRVRSALAGFVREHAAELDTDHDGEIGLGEFRAALKRMFDQADADRDGRIVPAEFERRPAPRR